jgi:hypothetical protein
MTNPPVDSGGLPSLPAVWLQTAEGIAKHSLGYASIAEVPPQHRNRVLDLTSVGMVALGVEPPPGWQAALAKQCGWDNA